MICQSRNRKGIPTGGKKKRPHKKNICGGLRGYLGNMGCERKQGKTGKNVAGHVHQNTSATKNGKKKIQRCCGFLPSAQVILSLDVAWMMKKMKGVGEDPTIHKPGWIVLLTLWWQSEVASKKWKTVVKMMIERRADGMGIVGGQMNAIWMEYG